MAKLPGLFRRGSSYYLRVVLPENHPLRTKYPNGRWVQSLGPCSHREAVIKGTVKRAEVLADFLAPVPSTQTPPKTLRHIGCETRAIYLREAYTRWSTATSRTKDTLASCDRGLKLFEEQSGNPPIQQITRAHGEAFRSWLQTLPSSSKTARDRFLWVKSLLRYATEDLEWLDRNPWAPLDLSFKTTNKRRPWKEKELQLLFSQDLYTSYKLPKDRKGGADAAYWIPLLGIYTGARLGELAQLRVRDVALDEEIPMLSISDEGEGQTVKTEASIRLVPLHRELIRLGFLEYVETLRARGETMLWPCLSPRKGRPGGYFSQWFSGFRSSLGFERYPDFHCFRHTVRSAMAEMEIEESVIDTLLGHEVKGSTGAKVYTHRSKATLQRAVNAISYVGISLPIIRENNMSSLTSPDPVQQLRQPIAPHH